MSVQTIYNFAIPFQITPTTNISYSRLGKLLRAAHVRKTTTKNVSPDLTLWFSGRTHIFFFESIRLSPKGALGYEAERTHFFFWKSIRLFPARGSPWLWDGSFRAFKGLGLRIPTIGPTRCINALPFEPMKILNPDP